ncbi:MAG: hypothetical protein ACKO0V_20580 [bacterium]
MRPLKYTPAGLALCLSIVILTPPVQAEEPAGAEKRTVYSKIWEWKNYRAGKPRYIEHSMHRAGHPDELSPRAALPKPFSVQGYWVGGGASFGHGHAPTAEEGTWGWDKTGTSFLPRSLRQGYSHGRLFQGGMGAYATDHEKK